MQVNNPAIHSMQQVSGRKPPSPQLVKAANAFEANFLGELLKPMREDPLFGEGSGLGGDSLGNDGPGGAMGTVSNLASEAFAQAIAKQGGLGIARRVLAELAPAEGARSGQAGLHGGPECGGCAPALAMGNPSASALDAGTLGRLGPGYLPPLQRNAGEKEAAGKTPQTGLAAKTGRTLEPSQAISAIERRQ